MSSVHGWKVIENVGKGKYSRPKTKRNKKLMKLLDKQTKQNTKIISLLKSMV